MFKIFKFYKFLSYSMLPYQGIVFAVFLLQLGYTFGCTTFYEYYNPLSNSCQPCTYNCKQCFNADLCVNCVEGYYLNNNNQCQSCFYGCNICTDSQSCTTCQEGLYLDGDGLCSTCSLGVKSCTIAVVESCLEGFFMLGDICARCIDNCAECSDFTTCTQCFEGYYVKQPQSVCQNCPDNCAVCLDANTCTSCQQGYQIVGSSCSKQDCSSISPFCTKCSFGLCFECQKGKYLNSQQKCSQGASILCLQSIGPYHTNCKTSNYGCPIYAQVQLDDVCLPIKTSSLQELIYIKKDSSCPQSSCISQKTSTLSFANLKAFYKFGYLISIKLYTSPNQDITIKLIQDSQSIAQNLITVDASAQMSENSEDIQCGASCPYGVITFQGELTGSSKKEAGQITIETSQGHVILEAMITTSICTVSHCELCSSSVDCQQCQQPYFLQMIQCIEACDPGFYQYGRKCVLQCPSQAYPVRVSYECIDCASPCQTCSSQNQCLSCVQGYYLEGSECLLQCSSTQLFTNLTSLQCQSCPNPCTKCSVQGNDSNWQVLCLACRVGYVLQNGSCTYLCPQGDYSDFVSDSSVCLPCQDSCTSCYIDSNICLSCEDTFLLNIESDMCQNGYTCPSGYYENIELNICQQCHYPCKQCEQNMNKCTSCLKGSLYINQCPLTCPQGFYSEYSLLGTSTCEACVSPCLTCLSNQICISCENDTYLYQGRCLSECPTNEFYEQDSDNTCQKCIPPCAQCISQSECLTCSTGFIDIPLKKCTLQCNSTSYVNDNFECTICPSPCISCFSNTSCSQCQLPFVLEQEECISQTDCVDLDKFVSYNYDYSTGASVHVSSICIGCTYPCTSCEGSQIGCTSCADTYLLIPQLKTCQQKCPISYYQNDNQCLKCDSQCLNCQVLSNNCTQCGTGMYLHQNSCIQQCPALYYGDSIDATCKACQTPCAECYNIYLCKTCQVGKVLYNKVCIDNCPEGTIYDDTNDQCNMCTDNCQQCQTLTSNCTSCLNQFYFYQNQCLQNCPDFFYADSQSQMCQQCIQPCQKCLSDTQCTSCIQTYYLYENDCLLQCPDGFYEQDKNCYQCNMTICSRCETDQNDCTACVTPYFFDDIQTVSCVTICPSGTYPDSQTLTCKQCTYPCSECTASNICQACQTDYKLFEQYCYSACPVGYYAQVNQCLQCMTNCEICISSVICLKCTTNFYANQNNVCVEECETGFYPSFDTLTSYPICSSCPVQCIECTQIYQCSSCSDSLGYDLFLFNGLCLDQCPNMYYSHQVSISPVQNQCRICPQNCNKCSNQNTCEECLNSYMYNNRCYIVCPNGTYLFNQQICIDCVSPCVQCESQYSCLTCITNYFYYQNYCLDECPDDVWIYPENGSCSAECPYNKYVETRQCYVVGCGGMMVQLQGYCLQKCPQGYYVDYDQNCKQCNQKGELCGQNLFTGTMTVLRTFNLKLSIYFNQAIKTQGLDVSDIQSKLTDFNDQTIELDYHPINITYDEYSLTIQYGNDSIALHNAKITLPYIQSTQTAQSINYNSFQSEIYSYIDYSDQNLQKIDFFEILATLFVVFMFLCTLLNIVVKSSSFFQLLDFMQFVAATLYLQIQYPPVLQAYLKGLTLILWSFVPSISNFTPYTNSPSKYIQYFIDTSLMRTQGLTFILFTIILLAFLIIILINKIQPDKCVNAVKRIRYRHLTDLFGIFMMPLLIFSFRFNDSNPIDIALGIFIIIISIGYLILITYKLITAENYSQIPGLTGDLQDVQSTLGKLYTPFSFIRKIIFAFVLCIQPDRPISTLTILLVFTTLIMVCLFFYQPFQSIITDYICIFMETCLVLYVFLMILFGLNTVQGGSAHTLGIISVIVTILAILGGMGWLFYLTFLAVKKFYHSFKKQNEQGQSAANKNKQNGINSDEGSLKAQQQPKIIHVKNRFSVESGYNSQMYADQLSANNLISRKNDMVEQQSSQNQQFRHWNASQSDQSDKHSDEPNQPPLYLMKVQKIE